MYWMKPSYMEKKEKGNAVECDGDVLMSPTSTVSTLTMDSTKTATSSKARYTIRGAKMTDESLGPNGHFKMRLFNPALHLSSLEDCTVVNGNTPKCRLHRWFGAQTCHKIIYCGFCQVNLCPDCYPLFHTVPDLVSKKRELQDKYGVSNKKKKTSTSK